MKVLVIGAGSIGQRHYRNLQTLGYQPEVYDLDPGKTQIKRLNASVLKRFDVALICTPNHTHVRYATQAVAAGCHLFIEKPLSHNLRGVPQLLRLVRKRRLVNMVASNSRFLPELQFIKQYLTRGALGEIYSIRHEFGHFLPYWRPHQDYRKNYAARRAMGGGIILDDIHEFDLLFWLNDFAPVKEYALLANRASRLAIETEDQAAGIFLFQNKVLGVVVSDYLQQSYSRRCTIVGEKGTLVWDFGNRSVVLKTAVKDKKLLARPKADLNQMYIEELKYFFSCVRSRTQTFNSIGRAAQLLQVVIKKS